MHKQKKEFKPVITRVKLNPEQAVLTCNCYNTGWMAAGTGGSYNTPGCYNFAKSWKGNFAQKPWGSSAAS